MSLFEDFSSAHIALLIRHLTLLCRNDSLREDFLCVCHVCSDQPRLAKELLQSVFYLAVFFPLTLSNILYSGISIDFYLLVDYFVQNTVIQKTNVCILIKQHTPGKAQ